MTTKNWVGLASNDDWSAAANWSPSAVPGNGDDVTITNADYSVTLDVNSAPLDSLLLEGGMSGYAVLGVGDNDLNVTSMGATDTITIGGGALRAVIGLYGGTISASALAFGDEGASAGPGTITGFGLLNISGQYTGPGLLIADAGTLTVDGTIAPTVDLEIAPSSDLLIAGTATITQPLYINSNAKLEIGATATVAISAGGITNGAIILDGGSLNVSPSFTIGTGTTLVGLGTVTSAGGITGRGAVQASGGTLELVNAIPASSGLSFQIANGTASALQLDGAVGSGNTFTFLGTAGTLALRNDTGFNNTISGLNVGQDSAKTDVIDIEGHTVTIAGVSGQGTNSGTITLSDGAVLQLSNVSSSIWSASAVSDGNGGTDVFVSNPLNPPDFNGDGFGDILFKTSGGSMPIWEMNGSQIISASYTSVGGQTVGVPAPGWNIVDDTGDFNGDGKSDILWQTTAGQVAIWEMNGSQIQTAAFTTTFSGSVAGVPAPGWTILGVADFFGAGDNDILWQTNTGGPAIWAMNGTQIIGAGYTMQGSAVVGTPGPDWHIIGAGDFTGTGQDGILWRTDSGALAIWQMNGFQIANAAFITEGAQQVGAPGPDWHLITTGDFDGDGKSDLLWETNSGAIAIWEMNGPQIKAAAYVSENGTQVNAPSGWKLAGAADVNGDGKADLLWQTPGGQVAVWDMNGTQITGASYLAVGSALGATPPDWSIAQHSYNLV